MGWFQVGACLLIHLSGHPLDQFSIGVYGGALHWPHGLLSVQRVLNYIAAGQGYALVPFHYL